MRNQANFDVKRYDINLKVDPSARSISGFVDVTIKNSRTQQVTQLDLLDVYTIDKVERIMPNEAATEVPFERSRNSFLIRNTVAKNAVATFRIRYHGNPPSPPAEKVWGGGFHWETDDSGLPWIGLQCESEGARVWLPVKNHPSDEAESVRLTITVPRGLTVAANGIQKRTVRNENGWDTFIWETHHSTNNYGISINIGDYDIIEATVPGGDGYEDFPAQLFFLKKQQQADMLKDDPRSYQKKKQDTVRLTIEAATFLSQHFGPYPFRDEKLGIAHAPYIGMEHQTINAYGNHFNVGKHDYDRLIFHELTHEWFGNKTTAKTWTDLWLHEGLTVYAEFLFHQRNRSEKAAKEFRDYSLGRIDERAPIVLRPETTAQELAIGPPHLMTNAYYKCAWMLRSLATLIGEDTLIRIMRTFVEKHDLATTEDFLAIAQDISGADLSWFFDVYLLETRLPRLYHHRTKEMLELSWEDSGFNMPMVVAITHNGETKQQRVEFHEGISSLHVPADGVVKIDPKDEVLHVLQAAVFSLKSDYD